MHGAESRRCGDPRGAGWACVTFRQGGGPGVTGASAPPMPGALTAAQQRALAAIRAALSRVARYDNDEFAAWRYSEGLLTPQRLRIRNIARALLVHPTHLPHHLVAALAADC